MSPAELSKLKAERDMAKAILDSYDKRLREANKDKKVKPSLPNRFITKQLKRAS